MKLWTWRSCETNFSPNPRIHRFSYLRNTLNSRNLSHRQYPKMEWMIWIMVEISQLYNNKYNQSILVPIIVPLIVHNTQDPSLFHFFSWKVADFTQLSGDGEGSAAGAAISGVGSGGFPVWSDGTWVSWGKTGWTYAKIYISWDVAKHDSIAICSMDGIFTNIWVIFVVGGLEHESPQGLHSRWWIRWCFAIWGFPTTSTARGGGGSFTIGNL